MTAPVTGACSEHRRARGSNRPATSESRHEVAEVPDADRVAVLRALIGPRPCDSAVLFLGLNTPPTSVDGRGQWRQCTFPAIDEAAAAMAANADTAEVYMATAWFSRGGRRKAALVAKRSICTDLDDKAMPGATPDERHKQVLKLAGSLPCPALIIDSGGGVHPHLLLGEPDRLEAFDEQPDGVRHVEILGIALRLWFEATALDLWGEAIKLDVTDGAERLWRAGTGWNMKAGDGSKVLTPEASRWRRVEVASPARPEALGSIAPADLSFLAPYMNAAANAWERRSGGSRDTRIQRAQETGGEARECGRRRQERTRFDPGILPPRMAHGWPMRSGDASEKDWAVLSEMAKAGWHPHTAGAAIRARREAIGDPKGLRDNYVEGSVEKAYAQLAPVPSARPIPDAIPFPLECLPIPLANYLRDQSESLGCAVELIAVPYLTCLGTAIGTTRSIRLKPGWEELPLLWTATVSPSGSVKSPAAAVAMRALTDQQRRSREKHEEALAGHAQDLEMHKKAKRAWCADKEARKAPPQPPKRPVCKRLLVSDTTLEALIPILAENPRGMLLWRDELGGWLKSFNAYRKGQGGDLEQWLSIHSTVAISVDRRTDRAYLHAERPFVAITGSIQPRVLRRILTEDFFDCGLAARLLLTQPEPVTKKVRVL